MNDCVFSPICEGKCKCPAYLSMNTEEGYAVHEEYWERVRKANEPVYRWLEEAKAERESE